MRERPRGALRGVHARPPACKSQPYQQTPALGHCHGGPRLNHDGHGPQGTDLGALRPNWPGHHNLGRLECGSPPTKGRDTTRAFAQPI